MGQVAQRLGVVQFVAVDTLDVSTSKQQERWAVAKFKRLIPFRRFFRRLSGYFHGHLSAVSRGWRNSKKTMAVAQYLLERCRAESGRQPTPMKLMKLVYIAHGYMLGRHGRPLLDEPVEAWLYGPSIPSLYRAIRHFKGSPVDEVPGGAGYAFSENERAVMDAVVRIYGGFNAIALSSATHRRNTPWESTWRFFKRNTPISNDVIRAFYEPLLDQPKHSSL